MYPTMPWYSLRASCNRVIEARGGGSFEATVAVTSTYAEGSQFCNSSLEVANLELERERVFRGIQGLHTQGGLPAQLAMNLRRAKTDGDVTFLARADGLAKLFAARLGAGVVELIMALSGIPPACQ